MIRKFFFFLVPVLLFFELQSQSFSVEEKRKVDSLNLIINSVKTHDSTRALSLLELANYYYLHNPGEAMNICNRAMAISEKNNFLRIQSEAYSWLAYLYNENGETEKSVEIGMKALKIQEKLNDKMGMTITLNNLGIHYFEHGNYSKALEFYNRALKLNEEIGNKSGVATCLNNIGSIFDNQGNIGKALEYYFKCLKLYTELNEHQGLASCQNNIGFIYSNQQEHDKAIQYFRRSMNLLRKVGDQRGLAFSMANLGNMYFAKNNYDSAAYYFTESLSIRNAIGNKSGIAQSLGHIGAMNKKMGHTESALSNFSRALLIYEEIGDKRGQAAAHDELGRLFFEKKNYALARKHEEISLSLAKEMGFPEHIKGAAEVLAQISGKEGKWQKAFEYHQLFVQMRDSIINQNTRKTSFKQEMQYEYEKKAQADSMRADHDKKVAQAKIREQNAMLKQEQTQRYALYGGLTLLILFSVFMYNRFRLISKQKRIIQQQKEETEKAKEIIEKQKDLVELKQKEILASINYARRIQESLLPKEKFISRILSEVRKLKG